MKKNAFLILIAFIISFSGATFAQGDADKLNDYKYIVIPLQFSFQDEENEYLLNSWLKHLLDKENFETVVDKKSEYPDDLKANNCLGLFADVKSEAEGLFAMQTKLKLQLKNCGRDVVFETKTGNSRSKDFGEGYKEALEDAMTSFEGINYAYNGSEVEKTEQVSVAEEVDRDEEQKEEEEQSVDKLVLTLDKTYTKDGDIFGIRKIQAGYLLLNENNGDRIALLNETENGNILYSSDKIDGTVSIKEDGDLLSVEYFDKEAGKLKKLVYKAE